MKNWKNAEIIEVSISETASGDYHAAGEYYMGLNTHDSAHCSAGGTISAALNALFGEGLCHGVADNGNGSGTGIGTGTDIGTESPS